MTADICAPCPLDTFKVGRGNDMNCQTCPSDSTTSGRTAQTNNTCGNSRNATTLFKTSQVDFKLLNVSKVKYIRNSAPLQGLFVPFARVGSGDPVRVLRLFYNKYTGYI